MAKSISKNAIFKAMLNLFNIILPILVIPLVTRSVGKELYGYMGYGDSLTAYFLIFASFGIYQYGLREISKVRDDKAKLRQTFTSLFLFASVTNILASAAYMIFVAIFYKNEPYFYTCIVMGFNLVFNLFYVEWVNEALENYDFIAIKTMIVRIVYSALILLFVRKQEDYLFYLYLVIGFNFINNIISFVYVKRKVRFDFSNLEFFRHLKPMFYVVILSNTGVLYTQLDKIMLKDSIGGTTDVGYYYMAQRVTTIVSTLLLTVIQVTMPRLSNYLGNESKGEYLVLLKRVIKIYFLILFPASIGLLCLSKEAIYIFGGPEFLAAVPVMVIFSIHMLSVGVEGVIANQIIYLHGKEKYDAMLVLIGGILNLIFNTTLFLTGTFNMVTAISTTLLANLIVIGLEYRLVKKVIKLDIHLFAYENIKYFYYSLIFIPITFGIKLVIHNILFGCVVEVFACGLIYAGILIFTKDQVFFELADKLLLKFKLKR
ncbi:MULTISPECIES: oligosaccharide flippase family protein [Clostridium]|jgi:Membrane protein involved in the export of O-antigen and teichoic acid|nr:oligosaccharide flippase family protein [Clostridium beijerinckii]AJH01754.1 capsular biosynthesis protein [Clostridium beijerinckii]ALB44195.1 flippase [Clostridium beijerinckii NRRL B-598]AQS07551.1 putative O-antigen transporter [Clostridium beijerinckii]MBA2884177.1 O-antigen/teichoic acid export membrane protein [Clostridium beijerinckii]MBA2898246.1 O-antigen/teichoic acid export membrane protein [Clostridium beijerinckii]